MEVKTVSHLAAIFALSQSCSLKHFLFASYIFSFFQFMLITIEILDTCVPIKNAKAYKVLGTVTVFMLDSLVKLLLIYVIVT